MILFIDTSAVYSLIDQDDINHSRAKASFTKSVHDNVSFLTTNYVIVESLALFQSRIGVKAVRLFHEDLLPIIRVEWVDELMHRAGVSALLAASRRNLSLVDCVSFEIMRTLGIKSAFAFDRHFAEQGFTCIP